MKMNTNSIISNSTTNSGVINNAALNLLLASKDSVAALKFEAETGWSWLDACTTALEVGSANLLATKTDAEIATFEAATGWKWSDAVEEAILAEIEGEQRSAISLNLSAESGAS